jgi:hypothetical protein
MNKLDLDSTLFTTIDICSKEADAIMELIKKTFPNECVIMIEKINNPILLEKYNKRLNDLKQIRGNKLISEQKLFHGTDRKSVENIAKNGFLSNYSKVNAYGIGTYFAKEYKLSRGYATSKTHKLFDVYDTFIIANVILGIPVLGEGGKFIDVSKFDYGCNNIKNPTIYSIPYDDAAYPEYAITFYSENTY